MTGRSRLFALALILSGTLVSSVHALDWPQWLGSDRDGVWRETGLIEKFPKGGPKILWRAPVDQGYAGPAVASGRVYVMDWARDRDEAGNLARPTRQGLPGKERVLCLDAKSGKEIWKHEYACPYKVQYPNGPRCTPLVVGGRIFTLGAMGDLRCLNAADGNVVWSHRLLEKYKAELPVWGYASHPVLDGDRLICLVGGEGSAVVAFHKDDGKELWKALTSEEIAYSPPVLTDVGGKRQVIVWLSDVLTSLDPATGKEYWQQRYPVEGAVQRPSVSIATPVRDGNRLLVTSGYNGCLMMHLDREKPGATIAWRGKSERLDKPDGLHAVMTTPVLKGDHLYGICSMGELRCLDAKTGKQVWEAADLMEGKKAFCGTAFLTPQGDRFVIFTESGHLVLADLSPKGYREIDRAKVLEPTHDFPRGKRKVIWCHPAFAERCVFVRNDKELICASLAAG